MRILILEDDPSRHKVFKEKLIGHELVITDSSLKAIALLKNQSWDTLFLDHDLGGMTFVHSGENTGWEVARWLNIHKDRIPEQTYIHSMNPVGARKMHELIPGSVLTPFYIINWPE